MKIQFVGSGSAFNKKDGQSNALVIADSGKRLLIDCGSYCWHGMRDLGLGVGDIDALYVSHLHADHVGGIEELAFCTYFNPALKRPLLFSNDLVMRELWEQSLRGGLESIQGKVVTLTEYFECCPVNNNESFTWEGIRFTPVQTVHIMAGYYIKYSYGLFIRRQTAGEQAQGTGAPVRMPAESGAAGASTPRPTVFFTTDTQFCPNQIMDFYQQASIIFHDCETSPFKSGVHANYDSLRGLPAAVKAKMWLYHYQPDAPQDRPGAHGEPSPCQQDGFAGFVHKGQLFEIG